MRVRVLGPLEVEHAPGALAQRDRVVLAALLVRWGQPLSAEQLADVLWGEHPPASWLKVVHGCVSRLRRSLGPGGIETVPAGYRVHCQDLDLDRVEFEALVARGKESLDSGSPERAVGLFEQALALWRGRPFDELDDWTPGRLEAVRLGELRLTVQEDLLQARLDGGEHHAVAAAATVAVGEEPWRERRWAILALAQYRSGRQADALSSIRTARRALGRELGLDPSSELVTLERAILDQDPTLASDHEARTAAAECPWRGLSSYGAADQDAFFGRAEEVAIVLGRLEDHPLLVLSGPSGSGKSSLLLAGVAPALARRGRPVVSFTPGSDPLAAMTSARASVAEDPILLVDQFEEAFTLGGSEGAATAWLADLAAYAESVAPVVATLRADQMVHLTRVSAFTRLAEKGIHLVSPLAGEALKEVIEEPARLAGLRLEQGLVDLMLRDAEGQPGALPLLSHALVETWRRREGALLTVDGYRASGGLRGAVAASADRLYQSLSTTERAQLRRVMLRLVSLGEGAEPVRSALPFSVVADNPERRRVLDLLVRGRLVTSGSDSYELAHEALARAWPRLRTWLDEDSSGQRVLRHLTSTAAGWDALGRPDSELYRGARLQTAIEWIGRDDADLTVLEREFLERSRALAQDAQAAIEQRARTESRQNQRLRILLAGVVSLLLVAGLAGGVAVGRGRDASRDRDLALAAQTSALHESLVGRSLTLRETNRAAAALLALEAYQARPDALSASALLGTLTHVPGFLGGRSLGDEVVQGTTVPGTGTGILAVGSTVREVDLETGELGPLFDHPRADANTQTVVRVSTDGTRVAELFFDPEETDRCGSYDTLLEDDGRGCTVLVVFDRATGQPVFGPVPTPFSGGDLAIDRTGGLVAVTGGMDGDLATYDIESGRLLGRLPGLPRPADRYNWRDTGAVVFDRGAVLLGSMNGPVRAVDARTLQVRRTLPAPPMTAHNFLSLTTDGILVGAGDDGLIAMDADTGERRWLIDYGDNPDAWPCQTLAVAPAMDRLYCGSEFGEIEERDLADGQLTGVQLDPQLGEVYDLAIARDNELVAFSRGYQRWRLDGSGLVTKLVAPGAMSQAGYDDSGRYLALTPRGQFQPHTVLDTHSGRTVVDVDRDADAAWVGSGTLMLQHRRGAVLVDVPSARQTTPEDEVGSAEGAFAGPDGKHGWVSLPGDLPEQYELAEFDVKTGLLTGEAFTVPGYPFRVSFDRDGQSALVSYWTGGSHLDWSDETANVAALFDLDSGRSSQEVQLVHGEISGTGANAMMVGTDYLGQLREYNLETLEPVATLPGGRGGLRHLMFSADGTRLMASGQDGLVHLYDTATRIRIGSIPSLSPAEANEAWLRRDGLAMAVNDRLGVTEWSLDPQEWAEAVCTVAGRNLTRTEWATYLPDQDYRRTCQQFPASG